MVFNYHYHSPVETYGFYNYNIYGYGSDFFKNYIRVITNIGYVTILVTIISYNPNIGYYSILP